MPSGMEHDDEGAPRRYCTVTDCVTTSKLRELDLDELLLAASKKPNTFEEANSDPAWRAAMEELTAIVDNDTWSLMDLPTGHRLVGLKWMLKLKKDASGAVICHKAGLVAKGYVQRANIDFEEVFALVAMLDLAPRAWNMKLDRTWVELGFCKCTDEHGMYTRGKRQKRMLLGVYIDDLIVTSAD
ncbi:hypothetical protein AXG93_4079s1140 [Marchantia polymorpha subsp. ruderalis]|uniref:Reverse transcriptase Ty1/copia-type domain-containing protein n=1 Tax=Marchantia polymorpha subsp. ruderalis TaxID=1480154 RepID=A0A176VV69_MARPO|nr:hypothetical protein AXG93_4079s1140 [Marchantia polymorpha subsp. ruderalis]